MILNHELPVYKSSYDLLVEIFLFTKEFTKEFKYTGGESLKKETVELLIIIYRANSRPDKHFLLQEARERSPLRCICNTAEIQVNELYNNAMTEQEFETLKRLFNDDKENNSP